MKNAFIKGLLLLLILFAIQVKPTNALYTSAVSVNGMTMATGIWNSSSTSLQKVVLGDTITPTPSLIVFKVPAILDTSFSSALDQVTTTPGPTSTPTVSPTLDASDLNLNGGSCSE
jgi:hypothetical protein